MITMQQAVDSKTFNEVSHMRQVLEADNTPLPAKLTTLIFMCVEAIDRGSIKFDSNEARAAIVSLLGVNLGQVHQMAEALGVGDDGRTMH